MDQISTSFVTFCGPSPTSFSFSLYLIFSNDATIGKCKNCLAQGIARYLKFFGYLTQCKVIFFLDKYQLLRFETQIFEIINFTRQKQTLHMVINKIIKHLITQQ